MAHWASWHVSLSIPENRTQKYPKAPLSTALHSILKSTVAEVFKNKSFCFFLNILKILFSGLCLGSSNRLTNYWHILKSVPYGKNIYDSYNDCSNDSSYPTCYNDVSLKFWKNIQFFWRSSIYCD